MTTTTTPAPVRYVIFVIRLDGEDTDDAGQPLPFVEVALDHYAYEYEARVDLYTLGAYLPRAYQSPGFRQVIIDDRTVEISTDAPIGSSDRNLHLRAYIRAVPADQVARLWFPRRGAQ